MIKNKGFLALTVTQFLGALNDNAFKFLLTLYLMDLVILPELGSRYVSLASGLFVLPFLLFSTHAGYLADRFSKRHVAIASKFLEIIVMGFGYWALKSGSIVFLMALLFFMALQSTLFGPAKYGILPEMLEERELSHGNGIIQLTTFAAIIGGTALGGVLLSLTQPHVERACVVFVIVAVLGTAASFFITRVPAAGTPEKCDWNPVRKFWRNMKEIKEDRVLFLCILGVGVFWLFGAMFHIHVLLYGKNLMHLGEFEIGRFLITMAIGIGLGSFAAGKLSGEKVELGLVPLGCFGMGLFSLDLAFAYENPLRVGIDLFLAGFSAGFFILPLNTMVQLRSPKTSKGKVVATANVVSFLGVLGASVMAWVLTEFFRLDPAQTLAAVGLLTFGATACIVYLLRVSFVRFVIWVLTHSIYRIHVMGREHVPSQGPALLVCNHVSYVDPLLLAACVSRNIRFFMWRVVYEWKPIHWFFKMMHTIPISGKDGPQRFRASMQEARQALKEGHVVCIFAEGAITRLGQTLGFRKGLEVIAKDLDIPIVPVYLDRVWGSIFSFDKGKFFWKKPRELPYPVTVAFGKPLPAEAKAYEVRQAVMDLGGQAVVQRTADRKPLAQAFLRQAKGRWLAPGMADSTGLKLSNGKIVTGCVYLAHRFQGLLGESERVGVLFPASVAGALVNVALAMAGKVPVNLNFTMSQDKNGEILANAGIERVITSAKVIEGIKWKKDDRMILIEDLRRESRVAALFDWVLLWILPAWFIERWLIPRSNVRMDSLATLMFTSGSTGSPKGVMLTQSNILSNVQGLLEVFPVDNRDTLVGVLPFFHSFGFTGTIWFPLLGGIPVVYHKSPLEPLPIQKMVRQHKGTVLLATPTFLQMWTKRFKPDAVKTIRFCIVGAEKLRESVALEFFEKFGAEVLEGYGCTELSPVACVNVLNVRDRHEGQIGQKGGKVGRPLPGVSVKIVDPQTHEPVSPGEAGLLMVKGPNVMKGYWRDEQRTAEVLNEGWYNTGDIATLDEDGFIQITDRLSRFSKIGGEMVPHIYVEEELYRAAEAPDAKFFVTSIKDDRKGEALVVLHHLFPGTVDDLLKKMGNFEIPRLWIPDRRLFFALPEWPTLGTGKVDIAKARSLAQELTGGRS